VTPGTMKTFLKHGAELTNQALVVSVKTNL